MKIFWFVFAVLFLNGCVPSPFYYSSKRVINQPDKNHIFPLKVNIVGGGKGIAASYIASSTEYLSTASATFQYFSLSQVEMDSSDLPNFTPRKNSMKLANRVAEHISAQDLDSLLLTMLMDRSKNEIKNVSIRDVKNEPESKTEGMKQPELTVYVDYVLSVDSDQILVLYTAAYDDPSYAYIGRPVPVHMALSENVILRPETTYSNVFVYHSNLIPTPKEVSLTQQKYRDAFGRYPRKNTVKESKMLIDLKRSNKRRVNKRERYDIVSKSLLEKDANFIHVEIEKAHTFFIENLLTDMFRTDIPQYGDEDKILETYNDGRMIVIKGGGLNAGRIHSIPKSTYAPTFGTRTSFTQK